MTVSAIPAGSIGGSFTPFEDRVEVIDAVAAHAEARGLAFVAVAEAMRAAAVGFGQSKLPRNSPTVSPRSTNLAANVRRFCAITDYLRMAGRSVAFVTWVGGSSTSLVDTPMRWARLATACA